MKAKPILRVLAVLLVMVCVVLAGLAIAIGRSMRSMAGCDHPDQGPVEPGDSVRALLSGGQVRCYLLHIPPGHDLGQPSAVVISLHGFASNPKQQEGLTLWNDVADSHHFVVVYPQGTSYPLRWNASPAVNAGTIDDVQFLRDLIAEVERLMSVDPARIYINGMSNGGGMMNRIACTLADTVAAVGIVAGAIMDLPEGCHPSRPIPLIAFHGTADSLVPYQGGTGEPSFLSRLLRISREHTSFPPVRTWIQAWAERNGCNPAPQALPASGDASGIGYIGCRENAEVILHTIEDGGHTWPGGALIPSWLLGKTSTDINASERMWQFYQAHPLTAEP